MENEAPTFITPSLSINRSTVTRKRNKQFDLPIILSQTSRSNQKDEVGTRALVDSGAEDNFIDATFTKLMGFKTLPLDEPIKVYNVDGTRNKEGTIFEFRSNHDGSTRNVQAY